MLLGLREEAIDFLNSLDHRVAVLDGSIYVEEAGACTSLYKTGPGPSKSIPHDFTTRIHAGQTGGGLVTGRVTEPTVVEALGPIKVASVAAGLHHSVALTEDGDVYCWGGNADGQLGDGSVLSSLEVRLGYNCRMGCYNQRISFLCTAFEKALHLGCCSCALPRANLNSTRSFLIQLTRLPNHTHCIVCSPSCWRRWRSRCGKSPPGRGTPCC